ncbi:M56 family metallopeptidase [Phycobacter azelaicus]|uniref:M56 family metallopeptidase n=1 Tax=Phycobacter azelaicus TaxID=2668075 RepID=UPI0018667723|nr:M56 family metallopeptidase [Phycobacter azelaicus]
MQTDALLNAYIDLNILLLAGAMLWLALRSGLARTRLGKAYRPQLRLLNAVTVLLALSPLLVLALTTVLIHPSPNLSDLLVAQYLQGNVGMSAVRFEDLLGLREDVVRTILNGQAPWARLLVVGFAAGGLICSLQLGLSVLRLRKSLTQAFLWKRIGRTQLLLSDEPRVAYSTRGIWARYVVLPTSLLEHPKDLRLSVAHELQHFRQRDIECEFLLSALRPLLFWNPAFFLWRREVRQLREFACDQALMSRPSFDLRGYCECLIRACANASRDPVLFARRSPTVALADRRETRRGSSALVRRLHAVTAAQPNSDNTLGWAIVSSLLVASVMTTALLLQRPADWSHDRIMLSTIVNLERMATRTSATQPMSLSALSGSFAASSQ